MSFANDLRKWRGVKGRGRKARGEISQAEAAEILAVPLRTLQDWESGRHEPAGFVAALLNAKMKPRSEKNAGRPVASSNRKAKGAPSGNGTGKKRVTNGSKKTKRKK